MSKCFLLYRNSNHLRVFGQVGEEVVDPTKEEDVLM